MHRAPCGRLLRCVCFFVFLPLRSRYRFSGFKTGLLVVLLIAITVAVTIFFLTADLFFPEYSTLAILFWIVSAVAVFRMTLKGSGFELLFIVLVVLNLYVNIIAIAKIVVDFLNLDMDPVAAQSIAAVAILIAYIPLLWSLFVDLYKQVIEFKISPLLWKFIWIIPALAYMIFFVKIVHDYWKKLLQAESGDIVFSILWSFTTYVFFWVTLQMVIQVHKGITAAEQTKLATAQLSMQEEQYKRQLENIKSTSRLRHDWRHHLLTINGFTENGDIEGLREYLKNLIPEYTGIRDVSLCQNYVVNMILQHYAAMAEEQKIHMEVKTDIPKTIAILDTDLCIVFGNLVENAIEACMEIREGMEKSIIVKAEVQGRQLILLVKNTYQNNVAVRDGGYCSTKHTGLGIGLTSVNEVVKKYGGLMRINYDGSSFCVSIFFS